MFLLQWKTRIKNVCVIAYFRTDLHRSVINFTRNVSLLQLFECWLCPSPGMWEGYLTMPDSLVSIARSDDCLLFGDYDKV
jgi:hypothetical protein